MNKMTEGFRYFFTPPTLRSRFNNPAEMVQNPTSAAAEGGTSAYLGRRAEPSLPIIQGLVQSGFDELKMALDTINEKIDNMPAKTSAELSMAASSVPAVSS